MPFVLDCSVAMAWVFPEESSQATDRLRDSLVNDRAFVPSIWPIEIGQVSTTCVWGPARALADRHNLSVHDATYLELALHMRLPLATLDRALAAAARAAGLDTPATA